MIGPTGATGRGPAMAAFWERNEFAGTDLVVATATTGFTRAFTVRRTACLFAVTARRCLRLTGGVPLNPIAAKTWIAKKRAMARETGERDALIIGCCSSPDE